MIVFVSDAGFHTQGDGFLNGLLDRHDELCHLSNGKNVEKEGGRFDYPSMGQAARILNDHHVMLGITFSDDPSIDLEHVKQSYRDLESLVTSSELQTMESGDDTRDTAAKIFKLYQRLAYRAIVTLDDLPRENLPFKWEIKKTEHFDEHGKAKETPKSNGIPCKDNCSDVLPRHTVKYTMEISHLDYNHVAFSIPDQLNIRIGAVEESLPVTPSLIDSCDCDHNEKVFENFVKYN